MSDQVFVCSIGVRGRDNVFIPAGRSFIREALVKHSFDRLESQGYISGYQREVPIQPIGKVAGNKLAAGLENETPDAAINPIKQSPEKAIAAARQATLRTKTALATNAQDTVNKSQKAVDILHEAAAEEVAAQEALKIAEGTSDNTPPVLEELTESTIERIWVCDPEQIKDLEMPQLLTAYRDGCARYNLDPEEFDSKELLVAKLSSQFVR